MRYESRVTRYELRVDAIETQSLTRAFGPRRVVDGLNMRIPQGVIFGFLGPNGAGKTTTVRLLTGLISATSGTATVLGRTVAENLTYVRHSVGLLTETPGLYDQLNPAQNLRYFGRLYGVPNRILEQRVDELLRTLDLWEDRRQPCGALAKGLRQKVAIARALLHEPKLVFLDEPTSGLDPEAARSVRELVKSLRAAHRTVFLTTHNLAEAEELCDQIGIFRHQLLATGSLAELRRAKGDSQVKLVFVADAGRYLGLVTTAEGVRDARLCDSTIVAAEIERPEVTNPQLIRRLVSAGAALVTIEIHHSTLEEVYLDLVQPSARTRKETSETNGS